MAPNGTCRNGSGLEPSVKFLFLDSSETPQESSIDSQPTPHPLDSNDSYLSVAWQGENLFRNETLQDSRLFGLCSAAEFQPVSLCHHLSPYPSDIYQDELAGLLATEPQDFAAISQPLYTDDFTQLEDNIINSKNPRDGFLGQLFAAEPPFSNEPILNQEQGAPLFANNAFACRPAAKPQDFVATPQPLYADGFTEPGEDIINSKNLQYEFLGEFPTPESQLLPSPRFSDELILIPEQGPPLFANNPFTKQPVAEPQGNVEHPQAEPSLERTDPQPYHPEPQDIPRYIGNQLDQESRCKDKCHGSPAGSHECSYQGKVLTISCRKCLREFARRNDFNRHWNHIHGGKKLFDCPTAGCNRVGKRGFGRQDNLTQHRRLVHREDIAKNPVRYGRNNNAENLALGRVGSSGE